MSPRVLGRAWEAAAGQGPARLPRRSRSRPVHQRGRRAGEEPEAGCGGHGRIGYQGSGTDQQEGSGQGDPNTGNEATDNLDSQTEEVLAPRLAQAREVALPTHLFPKSHPPLRHSSSGFQQVMDHKMLPPIPPVPAYARSTRRSFQKTQKIKTGPTDLAKHGVLRAPYLTLPPPRPWVPASPVLCLSIMAIRAGCLPGLSGLCQCRRRGHGSSDQIF